MTTTDRTIPRETLEEMLRTVEPEWQIHEATLAERGYCAVYHVHAETPLGTRTCVLKATPDGDRHGIDAEARLLSLVGERTSLPVPGVLGAVDDHEMLPAPFFLMESMDGCAVPFRDIGNLSDATLERLARETGAYLAELHALDAVETYGFVDCDRENSLRGGRPSDDADALVVTKASDSWPAVVREWADQEIETHETTQFADLTARLAAALDAEIEALSGPFDPALARIDHGLHNVLIDPGSGSIEAILDWAFTLATTPAYDLSCVEFVLSGRARSPLPDTPARHELVRAAILDGYRSVATRVPPEYVEHRRCYDLLMFVRAMSHVDAGVAPVSDDEVDRVAAGLREEALALLDEVDGETTGID